MFRRHLLTCVVVIGAVLGATACGVPPTAADTDTLDLGAAGRWSAPDVAVSAEVATSYSPRGPRSTVLTVTAGSGADAITFSMREENVAGAITPATVGDFPGIFAPPHFRVFGIARPGPSASGITVIGDVRIDEIELGSTATGPGPTYRVTRLRAAVALTLEPYGLVNGYLTIG